MMKCKLVPNDLLIKFDLLSQVEEIFKKSEEGLDFSDKDASAYKIRFILRIDDIRKRA